MRLQPRGWLLLASCALLVLVFWAGPSGGPGSGQALARSGAGPVLAQPPGTSVYGTVRAEDQPVPGVTIVVEQGTTTVGQAQTDQNGAWEIPLPRGGSYTIRLVDSTLPEGLGVREPGTFLAQTRTVEDGRRQAVLFPVESAATTTRRLETLRRFLNLLVDGVKFGAVIALASLGLSLVFGTTGLVNFAHGEMVTIGAVIALELNSPGGVRLHLIPATLLAVLGGGGTGLLMERGVFGPLRRRRTGLVPLLVVSIGLSIVLRYGVLIFIGGQDHPYRDYTIQRSFTLGPLTSTPKDLVITVISLLVLGLVGLLLLRTRLGTAIRAVADNRDLAEASGIDVDRVILAVWVTGGALAALGGVFQGMIQSVTWDMGFRLLLLMFAAIILGGLGSAFGAMVGGLVVGIVTQVSTVWFSVDLKLVFAFAVLIAVLLVRPQGILGRRERIG